MLRSAWGRAWVLLAALASSGCVHRISDDKSTVGETRGECVVPAPLGVPELAAPVSLEYPDASLWIWDSLTTDDGGVVANPSARVASHSDPCGRGPNLARDAAGAPRSLLALSSEELADNAARSDGRQLVLSARGGFVHDDVGYLYYEHALVGPGVFDVEELGTGLCVVSDPEQPCERILKGESSVLWAADEWPKNQGGMIDGERAYVLGCRRIASFDTPCVISSVPLDRVRDPSAYRYFDAFNGWVEAPESASVVLNWAGAVTLGRADGRYVATNLDIFDARVSVRFAPTPTGNFGMPIDLFRGQAPNEGFARGGREHSALRSRDRSLAFTYFVADEGPGHGLHLIDFELNGGLE